MQVSSMLLLHQGKVAKLISRGSFDLLGLVRILLRIGVSTTLPAELLSSSVVLCGPTKFKKKKVKPRYLLLQKNT